MVQVTAHLTGSSNTDVGGVPGRRHRLVQVTTHPTKSLNPARAARPAASVRVTTHPTESFNWSVRVFRRTDVQVTTHPTESFND